MEQLKIGISLGDSTDNFLEGLFEQIDDQVLDELQVERELQSSYGLAGEPITVGAVITGGTVVISAVLRLIERYLEHKQQLKMATLVAEGFAAQPELGAILAEIAKKNAEVSIRYGIAREAWTKE